MSIICLYSLSYAVAFAIITYVKRPLLLLVHNIPLSGFDIKVYWSYTNYKEC